MTDRIVFHETLGEAVITWQGMETGLFMLAFMLGEKDLTATAEAFYQETAGVQLDIADAVCRKRLPGDHGWPLLHARIKSLIGVRNLIVHSNLVETKEGLALSEPMWFRTTGAVETLDINEIRDFIRTVRNVYADLQAFTVKHGKSRRARWSQLPG